MGKTLEEVSVGELARRAKVSIRTLHHYDEIGLLKPKHVGANGYRMYGRAQMLRLQEILFHRALGMELAEIGALLAGPEDMLARLLRHRARLTARLVSAEEMLAALDRTIAELKGDKTMANENLYGAFPSEKQTEYEALLIETYGGDMPRQIAQSQARVAAMTDWKKEDWTRRLQSVEARLASLHGSGMPPTSREASEAIAVHWALVGDMVAGGLPPAAYRGIADLYETHPDFIARYEQLSRGLSQWLPAAMRAHVDATTQTL